MLFWFVVCRGFTGFVNFWVFFCFWILVCVCVGCTCNCVLLWYFVLILVGLLYLLWYLVYDVPLLYLGCNMFYVLLLVVFFLILLLCVFLCVDCFVDCDFGFSLCFGFCVPYVLGLVLCVCSVNFSCLVGVGYVAVRCCCEFRFLWRFMKFGFVVFVF